MHRDVDRHLAWPDDRDRPVTTLAACALAAFLLAGCSPAHARSSSTFGPSHGPYTLAIVSGDHQSGVAVLQPVVISGGVLVPAAPSLNRPLPHPLVVEVRDARGVLVDGVLVMFSDPTPGLGVIGLGQNTTGLATTFTDGQAFGHELGRAAVEAQPYRVGSFPVECRVDPASGSSNVVVFEVTGT